MVEHILATTGITIGDCRCVTLRSPTPVESERR